MYIYHVMYIQIYCLCVYMYIRMYTIISVVRRPSSVVYISVTLARASAGASVLRLSAETGVNLFTGMHARVLVVVVPAAPWVH